MMNVDIKTLAYMYGVTDMYTQLRIMQEDGKTKFAAAGTFFRYKNETRESSHGFLLKVDTTDRAVNLYTGTIVPVLDAPYEVIQDIEIKGWV